MYNAFDFFAPHVFVADLILNACPDHRRLAAPHASYTYKVLALQQEKKKKKPISLSLMEIFMRSTGAIRGTSAGRRPACGVCVYIYTSPVKSKRMKERDG